MDEAHFPGAPACTLVGTPCSAGDFPTDLPGDAAIVYIRSGAPAGGDGWPTAPFGTIGEAVGSAPDGAVVAISKGTFDEIHQRPPLARAVGRVHRLVTLDSSTLAVPTGGAGALDD
jgi:hypothetical protein